MTTVPRVLSLTLLLAAAAMPLAGADAAAAGSEDNKMTVEGGRQVKVSPKKEITFNYSSKDDDDLATRELWYSTFTGTGWSDWQKHALSFAKDTPIVWAPPEAHLRVYIRPIKKSGAAAPIPDAETHAKAAELRNITEFIIDRTAPQVAIESPESKAKLRGGVSWTIKWKAEDPHLRGKPITIEWSRDGKGGAEVIAADLTNTGTFDWMVPKDMTSTGILKITATDKAGNSFTAESGQILVDSMNPKGSVLGPKITAKRDLALDIEVKDAGPAGLKDARMWWTAEDNVNWTEGPFITDPAFKQVGWTAPADGKYRLYILATDNAGNPSPTPKGKDEANQATIIVDSTKPVILLPAAIGIIEAEKAVGNRSSFKAGTRVQVPFTVKDANLVPNSASIYLQTDAAKGFELLAADQSTDTAYRFELPSIATKVAKIKVTAKDIAGNVGEVEAGDVFQIDTTVDVGTITPEL
jgi:hypothetical protein